MTLSLLPTAALAAREEQAEAPLGEEVSTAPVTDNASAQLMAAGTVSVYKETSGTLSDSGVYVIYNGGRSLHNSGTNTNQCTSSPSGNTIDPGHASDSYDPSDHLWTIAGNVTDGYTIQGVTSSRPNYLTTTVANTNQLALNASADSAAKFTITPVTDGYQITVNDGATKYLGFRDDNGWKLTENASTVRLFKQTALPVTITDASDNSQDVGVTNGTYSNTNSAAVHAWASSQHASGTDGPATWATDGNESSLWHTRYNGGGSEPNTDQETTNQAGYSKEYIAASEENRWIELDIRENSGAAQWLSGLRYKGRNNNNGGNVDACDIRVSPDGVHWESVTSTNSWTIGTTRGQWQYKEFDYPVLTSKVRLYGITTYATNSQYMVANEIRLVKALEQNPTTHDATITVNGVADGTEVTVMAAGQVAAVTGNSTATFSLIDGQEYTVTATAEGYAVGKATVTGGESATATVALTALSRTISGTVTTDGSTALEGAKVELVQNNDARSFVRTVAAVTTGNDGTYTLNVNSVAAGQYRVRVSKDGYGALLSSAVTVAATADTETYDNTNVTLPLINQTQGSKQFIYNMTSAEGDRPTLGFEDYDDKPTYDENYPNDKLVLNFTSGTRSHNLVRLEGTNVKNGTIEFDATRTGEGSNAGRFGLALRYANIDQWIYIGTDQGAGAWFQEFWNKGHDNPADDHTDYSGATNKATFGTDDTRHFKVTITEGKVSLIIDGETVFDNVNIAGVSDENAASYLPMSAADVGFICGNNSTGVPSTITIDNLYIFREDQTYTVTLGDDPALTAKITSSAGDEALGGNDTNQAAAGDVIKVTCPNPSSGKILGAVSVTETTPAGGNTARTVTATMQGENDDTYFTFTMPEYDVTVAGELKDSFTAAISGTPKVGEALNVTIAKGTESEFTGSYQWYRVDANNNLVRISEATGASYTPVADDQGKTLKVVVTGTGSFAGIRTATTTTVAAADTQITSVTIARSTIKMIMNGDGTNSDNTDPANTVVSGNTTTLTATVSPDNATGLADSTVEWTVEGDAVELGTGTRTNNVFSKPITAVKNGTATVTATARSANGSTQTDSVTITVVTKVEKVTIKNGDKIVASTDSNVTGEGLILHANTGLADHPNSADLIVEVYPEGATTPAFNWARADGNDTGLLTISGDATDGSRTFRVNDTSDAQKVGTKDFKLTVTSTDVGPASTKELTFNVTVRRYLQNRIDIGLGGKTAPTIGQLMEADVSQLVVGTDSATSESAKASLTYKWYALDSADAEIAENATPIHSDTGTAGKSYTPAAADAANLVGKWIAVQVTATPTDSFFYEGTVTARTTNAMVKMDGPTAPTLSPTKPTSGGADNSGYITITNYTSYAEGTVFLIKAGDSGNWETATVTSEGKIENLSAGKYFVKIQATDAQLESEAAETTIAEADAVEYTIAVTQPTEGATISVTDKAVENAEMSITLNVTEGWQVDAVTVTDADNGSVTVNREGTTNVWKFSMPAKNVTVTATVSKIQLKIKHNLTNMRCNLNAADENHVHTVNWGEVTSITFIADEGYDLPASTENITVKVMDAEENEGANYAGTLTYNNGTLGFGTNGLRSSISITAAATKKSYTVSFSGMNGLNRPQTTQTVEHGGTYTYTLTAMDNYARPENITIAMAGNDSPTYTYDKSTGAISISNVTGAVTITANGVRQYNQVTGASITQTSLEVDSILSSSVQPSGAVVSYQWMRCATEDGTYENISGANAQTYTLTANDVDKYIKLKVTGDNDHNYDGTQTSNAVGPVVAKTIATIGVVIQENGTNITQKNVTVGDADFTLTAVVSPDNATDKTVTWAIWQVNTDQVDTSGVLQLTPGANGTVSVKILKAGNVRIHVTNSGGQTYNCTVNVERAASNTIVATADNVSVTHDGQPHSITVNITQPANGEGCTIYYKTAENGEWVEENPTFTDIGTYTVYYQIRALNYDTKEGSATVTITEAPVTPTTYDVTFVLNGATLNVTSGQTNNNGVVAVEEGATLTFKLTVADTTKEVKSVKVGAAPGTPITPAADGTYSIVVDAAKYVVVEVGEKTVDPGPGEDVNTADLEAAIAAANAAKEGVQTIDGKTEDEVEENVKFVTTEVMTTLTDAIAAAEEALEAEDQDTVDTAVETLNDAVATFEAAVKTGTKTPVDTTALKAAIKAAEDAKKGVVVATDAATVPSNKKFVSQDDMDALDEAIRKANEALEAGDKTVESVAAAVTALNAAIETFNEAKQPGTKKVTPPVVVVPTEPDVTENPDGSKTTTETAPDGTVTETTEKTDGTTEVVETKPDGTVTETVTAPDGAKTEKVTTPDKAVEITVTDAEGETVAEVKLPAEITAPETRFEDVPEGHWADTAIHNVATLGLVEGVGDNKYNMDSGMTRGALATVLHRLSNKPAGSEVNFEDVANDAYYAPSVAWAAKVGVVTGFSKDTYKPEQVITREQMALMLMRYAKLLGMDVTADAAALDVFADGVNTHDWAVEGVAWCVKTGILQGKSETTLDPTANVTRAQVAVMLDRFVALMK